MTKSVRLFRMTIASRVWYDESAQRVREFEMHFKVARRDSIRSVRLHLTRRGIPYFQQNVYRQQKRWIPRRDLRVAFEREEPALQSSRIIIIEVRGMEGRGKRWRGIPYPSRTLSYTKRRRVRPGQSNPP